VKIYNKENNVKIYNKENNVKIYNNGALKDRQAFRDLDSNRVRYNWGFHDAATNHANKWIRPDRLTVETILAGHFDPIYAKGWVAGWMASEKGEYSGTSITAWLNSGIEDGYADHQIPVNKESI
jgi:hypothetical protein